MTRCGRLVLLIASCAHAVRVSHEDAVEATGNSSLRLGPGDACYDACGSKTGLCDQCGTQLEAAQGEEGKFFAHVCCRAASNHGACPKGGLKAFKGKYEGVQWKNAPSRECVAVKLEQSKFQVFKTDQVQGIMPQPWLDQQYVDDAYVIGFPDKLKGLIWMDQTGHYGHSDINEAKSAPDAVVSFGDMREYYRLKGQQQYVDIFGPGWTWFNNEKAYHKVPELQDLDFYYQFTWNDDFTRADIGMKLNNMMSEPGVASKAVYFSMEYQTSSEDASKCPPSDENGNSVDKWFATNGKDQTNKAHMTEYKKTVVSPCAKWIRPSKFFNMASATYNYYAFEIVDKTGKKQDTYFNKYVEWVNKNSAPDVHAAINNGMILPDINTEATSLVGFGIDRS